MTTDWELALSYDIRMCDYNCNPGLASGGAFLASTGVCVDRIQARFTAE